MLDVRDVSPEQAARALAGLSARDPRGLFTEGDMLPMCQAGRCIEVEAESGRAVVVIVEANGVHWVDAAQGAGQGMTEAIHEALRGLGAKVVGFQTERRGLVRRAEKLGYRVTGYIMRREL